MKQNLCSLLFVVVCGALSGCCGEYFGMTMPDNLQRHGVSADATIVKIWDSGWTVNDNPVIGMQVEVHPTDRPVFETTVKRYVVSRICIAAYQPGNVIRVRFDPNDLASIAVESDRSAQSTGDASDYSSIGTRVKSSVHVVETFVVGNSRFDRIGAIDWTEHRGGGPTSSFEETDRTDAYVQLYDEQRHLAVRLYRDRGEWYDGANRRWVRWTNESGRWLTPGP